MIYAVRNDGLGWRAVNSAADILPGETYSDLPPAQSLASARIEKNAALSAAYNTAIQQPVSYMSTTFQADEGSQYKLSKSILGMNGTAPSGFYWVDATNNKVTMNFPQVQGLAAAMFAQGWAAFQNLKTKKDLVASASTVAAVQGVVW